MNAEEVFRCGLGWVRFRFQARETEEPFFRMQTERNEKSITLYPGVGIVESVEGVNDKQVTTIMTFTRWVKEEFS